MQKDFTGTLILTGGHLGAKKGSPEKLSWTTSLEVRR
jgi:hypothetical protein